MITLSSIPCSYNLANRVRAYEDDFLRAYAAATLACSPRDIATLTIVRKSIDARHKNALQLRYRIALTLTGGNAYEEQCVKNWQAHKALSAHADARASARAHEHDMRSTTHNAKRRMKRNAHKTPRTGAHLSADAARIAAALANTLPETLPEILPNTLPETLPNALPGAHDDTNHTRAQEQLACMLKALTSADASTIECTYTEHTATAPCFPAPFAGVHIPQDTRGVVVVGAGCAGLFCALWLAHCGLKPLLLERGGAAEKRKEAIESFIATGVLNPEINIQFGIGGAGTYSDGKLNTGTKSPYHRLILQTFVEAGAPKHILWDAKPHIGSDILPRVVTHIVAQIRALGGEVRFMTKLDRLECALGHVRGVHVVQTEDNLQKEEYIPCSQVVLACGHSARDTYRMLNATDIYLEQKTFAIGYRIEHAQRMINAVQYGDAARAELLGSADYKIAVHLSQNNNAFSFCMCPGGYVVAATSEVNHVVTNGMSLSARAGTNACAGWLSNVCPENLASNDVLAGMHLQDTIEKQAFELGCGGYKAPAQLVGDFLQGCASNGQGSVTPTYPLGVTWTNVARCMPDYIVANLREGLLRAEAKFKGFASADAVLTGVETRSSAPVRIVRDTASLQSLSTQGLYPCGEGAGYAGGIMSAATDGIRVAQKISDAYKQ